MLRGRESLIRLVGKRRRFLPSRQSLLSTPIQSSLNLCTDKDGKIASIESSEASAMVDFGDARNKMESFESGEKLSDKSEKVTCPVCGNKIIGDCNIVNSHLDMCLSSKSTKKRKLTQRTLLQMNFCAPSTIQIHSSESGHIGNDLLIANCDESIARNGDHVLNSSKGVEENNVGLSNLLLHLKSVTQNQIDDISKKPNHGNNTDDAMTDRHSLSVLETPNTDTCCDVQTTLDDISGVILETFIVGRRFSDEKEINHGASIYLQRDPHNVKDPNAIKVISANSRDSKVFGFLPRELAQYLSPLIEKYCLSFEGQVTVVPKNTLDVVPIQILCHKAVSGETLEHDNVDLFRYLWRSVQQVIESTKLGRTGTTKYQQNFCVLVQEVLRNNFHLFLDDEKGFLESFNSFSDDSQRLFVRLYTRKVSGYFCSFEDTNELLYDDMNYILNLLNVSELREIMCLLKQSCNFGTRKRELIASLLSSYKDGVCSTLPRMILERTGACVKISSKAESLLWRAERLFFLNGEQDLSSFLLADLGIIKYPTYNCVITEQIFSNRNALLAYEEAIEVAQMIDQALDENDNELVLRCIKISESRMSNTYAKAMATTTSETMVSPLTCFSASLAYSKVLTLGTSFLERERRYNEAIYLLKRLLECFTCDGRRGFWILRLSIDLEHIGYHDESLLVAESGLLDTWVRAGSRMALQRRVLRLGKPPRRWKTPSFANLVKRKISEVHVQGRPLNSVIGMKSRFYGEDDEQCGVEQLALQYYVGEGGWNGVHTESGIWLTIFGLLMWDVMFSDVPNVFHNRFQTAPLDLETDSFYLVRKSSIESHLQKIHDGMAEEFLITAWESHTGTACRGVNWNRHTLSELRAAVVCIGGPCLALLCRHLAQDYRSWSSGMPDLLLWRFNGDFTGEAKLVEVKGPRDKLSEQQRAWLLFLMDCGFNTEVCKISPEPTS
ncbi:fanconi-associated nuclease 1 homolog isoform X2 [Humulus lupulus]|uniref:fanconi-associated nuclease 1 homolog isoform X2 n=1 Tax=Humulus lupulus TaxID=3486 RepID=UPI002B408A6D|nr:fanconi-associated nuclease 1 homolog isoform X2 [Humulus lupulus]